MRWLQSSNTHQFLKSSPFSFIRVSIQRRVGRHHCLRCGSIEKSGKGHERDLGLFDRCIITSPPPIKSVALLPTTGFLLDMQMHLHTHCGPELGRRPDQPPVFFL
ncbi:hypothetical protein BRADI_4g23251v3 [Brachypodium distachyon]|uniref:Uncharacterized protein n=1 Tax=Brachypodium distachyon TaxID=15368 RepID=A0A2K2CPM1_BRADI|nr:hypothetical protein BRADI_4g23251v3 [Brachypodium distachyon]